MITDPIADYLTRMRNALLARHKVVEIPFSKIKGEITRVLHEKGYIKSYAVDTAHPVQKKLCIDLKYMGAEKLPVIECLERISKPGLRKYAGASNLPTVINGLGIAILSTPQGIMTDKEARKAHIGGEVLCHVY